MNVFTDAKNLLHPKVYEEVQKKAAQLNMPIELAVIRLFNRMCMEKMGLPESNATVFWAHEESLELNFSKTASSVVVEEKILPKPPIAAKDDKEDDQHWYSTFPKRAQNAIVTAGIQNIKELVDNYGVEEFANLAGAGRSTALRLQDQLKTLGHTMDLKKPAKKAPTKTPAKIEISDAAAAALGAGATQLKNKIDGAITTKPQVIAVDEEDEIAPDYHKMVGDLTFDDPSNTAWINDSIAIYASAWGLGIQEAKLPLRDVLVKFGITSKDPSSWSKAKKAIQDSLPIQADQIDLIEKYAREYGVDDLEAYVLAEFDIEGGPEALSIEEGSALMAMLNKKPEPADDDTNFF